MAESLFEELKRYVGFCAADKTALRELYPAAAPRFASVAEVFYARILEHEGARNALRGGERQVGHLKVTLVAWMDKLLTGPWDESYFDLRCRIGRLHVRIALPQHYMFAAMNVVRNEFNNIVDDVYPKQLPQKHAARRALERILDLELAIMLHTYREDLVAQQARTERLATFGQLVGSISHELRNPLGVMESSLYLLSSRIGEDERAKKHVARIGEQLGIASVIISNLLDLIRDNPLVRERVPLAQVISALALPQPPGVRLTTSGLDDLFVDGDASQLRQVFTNLMENAIHAVGESGEVTIRGRRLDEALEIAIEDSGPGVDEVTKRRLFEPLITTKQKGVGLGLALVKRFVERHGGTIVYEPQGSGARFVVRLPAAL